MNEDGLIRKRIRDAQGLSKNESGRVEGMNKDNEDEK